MSTQTNTPPVCPTCGQSMKHVECFNNACEQGVIWEYSGDEAWRIGDCPYCDEGYIWACPGGSKHPRRTAAEANQ